MDNGGVSRGNLTKNDSIGATIRLGQEIQCLPNLVNISNIATLDRLIYYFKNWFEILVKNPL